MVTRTALLRPTRPRWRLPLLANVGLALALGWLAVVSEPVGHSQTSRPRRVTRLFYYDDSTATLRWADVVTTGSSIKLQLTAPVNGWPKIDTAHQHLTQLETSDSWLASGIRDDAAGKLGSGWIVTFAGVRLVPHGDHEDWRYLSQPFVADFRLDDRQGNPAHVYVYDSVFYIAHDLLNGYTRINPREYVVQGNQILRRANPLFVPGGGNHISLAVDRGRVGYACWIDRDGDNKGRVDISVIRPSGESFILYTFQLPWGGLHGATINSGKIFLAPEQNVVWISALSDLSTRPDSFTYHVIDLGEENGKPLRTGHFVNWKNYVLFLTGRDHPRLGILDPGQQQPKLLTVALSARKGLRPISPRVVQTQSGKVLALICQDKPKEAAWEEILDIVDLDPNGDGSFQDAKLVHTLVLGPSAVEGHFGHHGVTADADGRYAFVTNPGNGTIQVIGLRDFRMLATWTVGGKPSPIVAVGGLEAHHH